MKKIFVIGDINIDIFCGASEIARMGEEAHMDGVNFSIGGNAANFAVSLGKLGLKPELVSAIGNDFATGFLVSELKRSGIIYNLVKSDHPNGFSIVFLGGEGERSILSNKGAAGELVVKDIEKRILRKIGEGDLIYIGGYFHLRGMHKAFDGFLRKAKLRGAVVFFDFCFDEYGLWMKAVKKILKFVDIAFMDCIELETLTNEKNIKKAIKKLQDSGLKEIVLKLGSRGSAYYSGGESIKRSAYKVKCINSAGAGDVFNAGFVFGYMKGLGTGDCLKLGNFLAGEKIQRHGIILPSRKEIIGFLKR